jgi:hypothetical protein
MLINMMITKVVVAVSTVLVAVGVAGYYEVLPVPDPTELLPVHAAPGEPGADRPVGSGPEGVPGGEGPAKASDEPASKPTQDTPNKVEKANPPETKPAEKPTSEATQGKPSTDNGSAPQTNECGSGLAEVQQTHQPTNATCEGVSPAQPPPPDSQPGSEHPPVETPPTSDSGRGQVPPGNSTPTCENPAVLTPEQAAKCLDDIGYTTRQPTAPYGLPITM